MMEKPLAERVLAELDRRRPPAAFVTEVAAALMPAARTTDVEEVLHALSQNGRVLISAYPAPDVHLSTADLRIVARVSNEDGERAALAASDDLWEEWLRAFLSSHRCQ